eukprot:gene18592-22769_t
MNLAEATAALTQKDSEKASVTAEIEQIKERQSQGIVGYLRLSVYQVDGLPDNATASFDFVIDTYQAEAEGSLVNKGLSEAASLSLLSFEQT